MSKIGDILDPLGTPAAATPTTASGEAPLKAGEAGLLDPSGTPVAFPSHLVPTLLQQGYKLDTPEARNEASLRSQLGDGIGNTALATAAGAARGATLGLSDQLLTKTGAVHAETLAALDKFHPVASTVGNVAGTVGSALLAPEAEGVAAATESLSAAKAAGNAAEVAEAAGALNKARLALTGLDAVNPISAVSKIGGNAANALGGGAMAKVAGSAVEGAFYGLGQSASEQALGDPDLTAQKVIANVGLGALLGGAGSGAFQGIAAVGKKALGAGESLGSGVLKKANNYLLGTPESDTAYYVANQAAVNAAPEVEAIKSVIDDHVASVAAAHAETGAAYEGALNDVKALKPDNALVTDLHVSMDNQKKVLGELSGQLDQVLDKGTVAVPTGDIQHMIDTEINKVKIGGDHVFGAERAGVVKYLEGLKTQLANAPETIAGSNLRQVVRALRDDAAPAYGLAAGEFAAGKARVAQSIAESLNPFIKQDPEAAAILKDMAARSSALNEMRPYFGTPQAALSSLQSAAGQGAKNELRAQALEAFDKAAGENFVGRIKPFQDTQQVLENMKRQGVSASTAVAAVAHPSPELLALASASEAHEAAGAAWESVKRLSSGRSQSVIESYLSKTAKAGADGSVPKFSIEDTRALEHLASVVKGDDRLGGSSIWDAMRARGVLDRFSQSKANGSRNAAILGTLGAAAGSVVSAPSAGAAIGAMVGGAVDRAGGLAAKRIMDGVLVAQRTNKGVTSQLGSMLLEKLGPSVVAGMKASSIATILDHLQKQNSQDPREESRARSLGKVERHAGTTSGRIDAGVKRLLTGGAAEKHVGFQGDVEETMADIQELARNPEALIDRVHSQTSPMADVAPKLTQGVNDTAIRAVQYLSSKLPPQTQTMALDGKAPAHSKAQVAEFKAALDVVNDPLMVLEKARHGSLTGAHLEALGAVYPHLYDEIKAHTLHALSSQDVAKMPFAKKTALSRLLGTPLVRQLAPDQLVAAQAGMATQQAPQPPPQGPKAAGKAKLTLSERSRTDFQQSASRR